MESKGDTKSAKEKRRKVPDDIRKLTTSRPIYLLPENMKGHAQASMPMYQYYTAYRGRLDAPPLPTRPPPTLEEVLQASTSRTKTAGGVGNNETSAVLRNSALKSKGAEKKGKGKLKSPKPISDQDHPYYPHGKKISGAPYANLKFVCDPTVSNISSDEDEDKNQANQSVTEPTCKEEARPQTSSLMSYHLSYTPIFGTVYYAPASYSNFWQGAAGNAVKVTLEDKMAGLFMQLFLEKEFDLGSTVNSRVALCHYKCNTASKVVVKFFLKNNSSRFYREATALQHLKHDSIVRMVCAGSFMDLQAIVLHYCSQGDLDAHIGRMNLLMVIQCFFRICLGLDYIHGMHTIHGDLKTKNILISQDWQPRICDFDLALTLQQGQVNIYGKRGTDGFVAPEMHKDPYGTYNGYKTDTYSLGAVLFSMLFNFRLKGRTDLSHLVRQAYWPNTAIGDMLRTILTNLLTSRSERRWEMHQVMGHMRENFRAMCQFLDVAAFEELKHQVVMYYRP